MQFVKLILWIISAIAYVWALLLREFELFGLLWLLHTQVYYIYFWSIYTVKSQVALKTFSLRALVINSGISDTSFSLRLWQHWSAGHGMLQWCIELDRIYVWIDMAATTNHSPVWFSVCKNESDSSGFCLWFVNTVFPLHLISTKISLHLYLHILHTLLATCVSFSCTYPGCPQVLKLRFPNKINVFLKMS